MFSRIIALCGCVLCWALPSFGSEVGQARWDEMNPNGFEIVYRGASFKPKGMSGLRLWGAGYYDHSKIEPEYGAPMKSDMYGLFFGIEFKRSGGSVLGVYYHYGSEDTEWENSVLNGDVKHHQFGLTFQKSLPMSHILINANGGTDKYALRFDGLEELKPDGYQANLYPEFGFDIPLGKMIGFKPFAALHYHYLHHDEFFSEFDPDTGLEEADYHGLNNLLGLRTNLMLGGGFFTFQARASWVHEYLKESPTSLSYFGSVPGQFTPIRCNLEGDTARDWAWFGVGAKLGLGDHLRLFADYDLTLNARQTSQTVSCCLCLGW